MLRPEALTDKDRATIAALAGHVEDLHRRGLRVINVKIPRSLYARATVYWFRAGANEQPAQTFCGFPIKLVADR